MGELVALVAAATGTRSPKFSQHRSDFYFTERGGKCLFFFFIFLVKDKYSRQLCAFVNHSNFSFSIQLSGRTIYVSLDSLPQ